MSNGYAIFRLMLFVKNFKNYLPLILIILLASFLRFYMLDRVPVSMSDDEIREIYSSYSIAKTGQDIFGKPLPLVIAMDGFSTYGQVPIYISSLFFLFLPLNPFTGRLPYALAGVFSVFFFYFIIKKLFKNEKIAIFASAAFSVSVWHIQLSRFAIETDITFLFYLAGICLFLYSKNLKTLILSMFFFFLAFYSYSAMKLLFLPIFLILTWHRLGSLVKKEFFIILTAIILTFGSFGLLSITSDASNYGGSPFFFLDTQRTAFAVELERRASDMPSSLESLYHNKFTYLTRVFLSNYFGAFSPHYLFLNQEASGIYSIWGRGELYVFESIFLFSGAFFMFVKKRKEFYFILLLLLISPLPSALGVGNPTWTSRSAFMIFPLYAFIGFGIYSLIVILKGKNFKILAAVFIFLIYLYSVVGYTTQYYFDWSRSNAKYFSKSTKDLVYLIKDFEKVNKKIIVSGATENTLLHYAFYNQTDPKFVHQAINSIPIKFGNVTFIQNCFVKPLGDPYKQVLKNIVYISGPPCKYKPEPSYQIKDFEKEVVWNIYEN